MTLQHSLVAIAFMVALAFLARQTFRTWRGSCSGCGTKARPQERPNNLTSVEELTARVRKP
jgi:hypothetical protein